MFLNRTNKDIYNALSILVYGHDTAKKALINLVNRSRLRYIQKYIELADNSDLVKPLKLLLIGESGTGKTHLVNSLKKWVDFPLVKIDATDLMPTSASGGISSKDLKRLIVKNAKEVFEENKTRYFSEEGALEQTVVFIDEIDKLGSTFDSSGNWNKHTQSNFLTLIDDKEEFAGISWIFAGAFCDMRKNSVVKSSIGFSNQKTESKIEDIDNQLLKSGLITELLGRINTVVELDNLTEMDYKKILMNFIIPSKSKHLIEYGIDDFSLKSKEIDAIAKKALASKQGVRFLEREIDKLCFELEFNYEDRIKNSKQRNLQRTI